MPALTQMLSVGETMPFVSIEVWTTIFMIANTVLLFGVLTKMLFGPVKKILDDRQNNVEETYKKAADTENEAIKLKEQYERSLLTAKNEANDIVADAHKRATRQSDELIASAREKANELSKRAEEQIEREQQKAREELTTEIGALSLMLAEKIVEREISADDHKRLMDNFTENLGDVKWTK